MPVAIVIAAAYRRACDYGVPVAERDPILQNVLPL